MSLHRLRMNILYCDSKSLSRIGDVMRKRSESNILRLLDILPRLPTIAPAATAFLTHPTQSRFRAAPTQSTTSQKMSSERNGDPTTTILKADYRSPASSKTFHHALPSLATSSTTEKTQYLSTLRKSVTQLQEEVNAFLTGKMEEDKALTAKAGIKVDDKKEEQNYGEEGVEDDA